MRTLTAALALCLSSLSLLGAAPNTIVGYISDTKCAVSGSKAKTAAEWIKPEAFERCVKDCVKNGSEAVFVTEDNRILKFDAASAAMIAPFLGRKVSAIGTVTDNVITIDSVKVLELK